MTTPQDVDAGPHEVFLSLGANIGDALETLTAAIYALDDIDGLTVRDVSGVYRTAPWPPTDDPRAVAQDDYLNAVVKVACGLEPARLLAEIHLIEAVFGRDRANEPRWGPRTLDIDILLYADRHIETTTPSGDLVVPHPRLAERGFVLVPLLEIHPGGSLPDGRRLTRLLMELGPLEGIDLEVRLEDMPGLRIRRPEGPGGGPAVFERPSTDATATEHGAGRTS